MSAGLGEGGNPDPIINFPKAVGWVIEYDDATHKYRLDGQPVVSVTQVIDRCLPKPALTWWGYRVGLAAVVELARRGELSYPDLMQGHDSFEAMVANTTDDPMLLFEHKGKLRSLVEHKAVLAGLHPNAVKDDAGVRGSAIHAALETFGMGGFPKLADFPEAQRPYLAALTGWWITHEPEVLLMEVIVASRRLQYAGRFDLVYRDPHTKGLVLADLKTSRDIYPESHYRQLRAYAMAWEEMGNEPFERLEVVNARRDGQYVVKTATCAPEVWEATLAHFRAIEAFSDAIRSGRTAASRQRRQDLKRRPKPGPEDAGQEPA